MPSNFEISPLALGEQAQSVIFVPQAVHDMIQRQNTAVFQKEQQQEECMLNERVKSAQQLIGGTTLGSLAAPANGPINAKAQADNAVGTSQHINQVSISEKN